MQLFGEEVVRMIDCYICGKKSRVQYFDVVNGKFVLIDRCLNQYCKSYNKFIKAKRLG